MRLGPIALLIAVAGLGTARYARTAASAAVPEEVAKPFVPTPDAVPYLSLGYREMVADLLYVRLVGYFAVSPDPDSGGALAEAIVALDPQFQPAYEFGAIALTDARSTPVQARQLQAIALLERGIKAFPRSWKLPTLAGQLYVGDLMTTDKAQREKWDERGAMLLESASRKPGAPADSAMIAATLQTRIGKQQRAIENLDEILLLTEDPKARTKILEQLAQLSHENSDELAAEIQDKQREFDRSWKQQRDSVPPSMYVLIGPVLPRSFNLIDLATGGRDIVGATGFERLDPVTDP
ncbi:MAG TPA: hypothetical protein VGM90_09340 [Kofleriaceae bacterium]